MVCPQACISPVCWLSFCPLFIHFSLPFPHYPYTPLHSHHTQPRPVCLWMSILSILWPVMTTATDHTPSTIPMALISWLAAMQSGSTTVPLLWCVCAFTSDCVCAGVFFVLSEKTRLCFVCLFSAYICPICQFVFPFPPRRVLLSDTSRSHASTSKQLLIRLIFIMQSLLSYNYEHVNPIILNFHGFTFKFKEPWCYLKQSLKRNKTYLERVTRTAIIVFIMDFGAK